MSEILRVEFGALHHASESITTALRTMQAQLDQIERDAAPLVSTWQGDAQEAYHARQKRWREAADHLAVILRDIQRAVDDSAAEYQRTERDNTMMFGRR
jgi:early secretory antigenic target protein ESAT-6